jgi:dihydrofolate reductase
VAASLDGFIATPDGGVDWLKPYAAADAGFASFAAGIGGVLLGRGTYEKMRTFGPWAYTDRPSLVVTHRPIDAPPEGLETFAGPVAEAVARLRARVTRGDIWLIGGGDVAAQCAAEGVLDRIELYTIPVVLHGGLPLFAPRAQAPTPFRLVETGTLECGLVRTVYELEPAAPAAASA